MNIPQNKFDYAAFIEKGKAARKERMERIANYILKVWDDGLGCYKIRCAETSLCLASEPDISPRRDVAPPKTMVMEIAKLFSEKGYFVYKADVLNERRTYTIFYFSQRPMVQRGNMTRIQ